MSIFKNIAKLLAFLIPCALCVYSTACCVKGNEWDIMTFAYGVLFAIATWISVSMESEDFAIGFPPFVAIIASIGLVYVGSNYVQNGTLISPIDTSVILLKPFPF